MSKDERVLLGLGSGGTLMHEFIERKILSFFPPESKALADAALIDVNSADRLAFTTDSFVVHPLEFPGGDIGRLAICGTANDLAVMGAKPLYLSCGLIMEEGLEMSVVERVLSSMADTASEIGIKIVTGDTKVVEKGSADKMFINTSGIGFVKKGNVPAGPSAVRPGDKIIINGPVGQHGAAVMAAREGILDIGALVSDVQLLWPAISALFDAGIVPKLMRDPTRGGVATTLNEFAKDSSLGIEVLESSIPRDEAVEAYCDALGLDSLYVANEGKVLIVVPAELAEETVDVLSRIEGHESAAVIGEFTSQHVGKVVLNTAFGGSRILTMLAGEQLPRIC